MTISIFDLFSIGIGPSSSHTVGPMRAAQQFAASLQNQSVARIQVEVFGSLALTGKGHGTDKAIYNGLEGQLPESCVPEQLEPRMQSIMQNKMLHLNGQQPLAFEPARDFIFHYKDLLPRHSNGMRFSAWNSPGNLLTQQIYYSIGGGFIVREGETADQTIPTPVPYPFHSAAELLALCQQHQISIAQLMLANEKSWQSEEDIRTKLLEIDRVMQNCIEKGMHTEGYLPGILKVKRRAAGLLKKMQDKGSPQPTGDSDIMHWLNIYAMAVNEENAAGGRVVTAPTNGAAGIIPAVLNYYKNFYAKIAAEEVIQFLLTAAAIGMLYKENASISGAEVGCQGEVGVASSMAAAGLTAVLGGSVGQIEKAAEIAMEHHLGMTCDPVGGLVQIPCIERNAMGAVKAVNAARLALTEEEENHQISLDKVIATMRQTGHDMMAIYKETALGGLAAAMKDVTGTSANIPEC